MNRLLLLVFVIGFSLLIGSCKYEKISYHTKNGRVKYVKAKSRKTPAWFYTRERGYNKHARRIINRWDRNFR
jgi:hypothetical protein